jgi:multiple sugar transport system substrate-binding protein
MDEGTVTLTREDVMDGRKKMGWVVLLLCALSVGAGGVARGAELIWWSQYSTQDNKKALLSEVKKRFEAAHPGTTVKLTFYEKANLFAPIRATLTAGSDFPDVFTFDTDAVEFIQAGWLADLSRGIRWENVEPWAKGAWTRPGPGGKMGTWALSVEAASDEIYFNKKIFRQLGITIPADYAFTQDAFKEVVAKCAKAGYAGFSTGIADRQWGALFFPTNILLSKLGVEDVRRLARGELSWKDPRIVEVLRYYKELIDLGLYAKTMTSMTLADAHRYFHTYQKACMFPVGSWYTGRAFMPTDRGGQPKDFELGQLNYPLMTNGKGHREKFLNVSGSYAAAAKSPNLPLALELLNSFADVEVGNMWTAQTGEQTGIKTDPAKIQSPNQWYFEERSKVNAGTKWVQLTTQTMTLLMKPGQWDAWIAMVGQGMPNKLIGPDEALTRLEEARLKGK